MWRICLMTGMSVLLSACHFSAKPEVFSYQCEKGGEAQVTYLAEKAVLKYRGETHALEQAISASGARYRNAVLEWWSKGDNATVFTDEQGNAGDILDSCWRIFSNR